MTDNSAPSPVAKTSPSKSFFVDMLTRDIELKDALLDLLDNCMDGVVRQRSSQSNPFTDKPFEGYHARISIDKDIFLIEDNCGGIPLEVARTRAFAIGRSSAFKSTEADGATVGMYGIGMKRAIFKMGRNATVESWNDEHFLVTIDDNWLSDEEWKDLPIETEETEEFHLTNEGTRIEVTKLRQEVSSKFGDDLFIEEFRKEVSRHYALIVEKGFEVSIGRPNEVQANEDVTHVRAEDFLLLDSGDDEDMVIKPIFYEGTVEGVKFEIFAGLTAPALDKEQIDKGIADTKSSYKVNKSGWTVACNDRIVVWRDRTIVTGWGTAGVPAYHNQFSPVAGLVLLYADDPNLLPLTTTKRGIDLSSKAYQMILDLMRTATKELTSFTNRYKNADSRGPIFEKARLQPLKSLQRERAAAVDAGKIKTLRKAGVQGTVERLVKYPEMKKTSTKKRVSYLAEKAEIKEVERFLGMEDADIKDIGRETFDRSLRDARSFDE